MPALALVDRALLVERARHFFSNRAHGQAPPIFFSAEEWRTVRLLADMIIPRDDRSGSASDAGVPEFIDFIVNDQARLQQPIRRGLTWLDARSYVEFGKPFAEGSEAERMHMLDSIAWPDKATPALAPGVEFFSRFRDLTASGFWSSPMGVADLQYMGNTVVVQWDGCPSAALEKLGVRYEN